MTRTIAQARRDNSVLQCSARSCTRLRHFVESYCVLHRNRYKRHGHPEALAIRPEHVAPYRAQVADFLERHAEHPGVVAAVRFMEQLLRGCFSIPQSALSAPGSSRANGPVVPLREHLQRLFQKRLSAREALERVMAVWLFSWREPVRLPDDERLTFALGRALMRARPQRCRFTGTDSKGRRTYRQRDIRPAVVRAAGLVLREGLLPFAANLLVALDREGVTKR